MYWRHVVASTIGESESESTKKVIEGAAIDEERVGSDRYQSNHMALIFQEGLSFSGFERNKVFLGTDGGQRYADVSDVSGGDTEGDCRATVVSDFDDDGDPDLFVNAIQRNAHYLFRNDIGNGGKFVKLRLRATVGSPTSIGATVRLVADGRTQTQVLSCGSGFESQNSLELIFGLGDATSGEVEVHWPGRAREAFGVVAANGRYLLTEGRGAAIAREAKSFRFAEPPVAGVKFRVGDTLPNLAVIGADGTERSFSVVDEKPLILNFWATTCRSCLQEMALFDEVRRKGKYRVLAVSLDPPSRASRIDAVRDRLGVRVEMVRATETLVNELLDPNKLAIPLTVRVSPEGRIEKIWQGKIRAEELE